MLRTTPFLIGLLVMLASGCSGVTFGNAILNQPLPSSFTNRTLWEDTSIFQYRPAELAGMLLYESKDEHGKVTYDRKTRLLSAGYVPEFAAIKSDEGQIYSSKIDRGAGAQGSYLAFAASFDEKQTADVSVTDAGLVFIPWDQVPLDLIKAEAAKVNPTGARRWWVQAVLLTQVVKKTYTAIKLDASGVVGDTFGAKGSVFNNNSSALRDPVIGLLLVDVDKFAEEDRKADISQKASPRKHMESLLSASRGPASIRGELR